MPLRRELIPILQRVLKWVRENRKMFTRFGTVLVGAFKLIGTAVKSMFRLVQPIILSIQKFLTSIIGDTGKSITETINLVIFKLTTLAIAAQAILQPLFNTIAKLVGQILKTSEQIVTSLAAGFTSFFDNFGGMGVLLTDFENTLSSIVELVEKLTPLLKTLSTAIGVTLGAIIKGAFQSIKILTDSLVALIELIEKPKEFKAIGERLVAKTKTTFGLDFEAPELVTMPERQRRKLAAAKAAQSAGGPLQPVAETKNVNAKIELGDVNVNVTEGSAEAAGTKFGEGVAEGIRTTLLDNMVLEGGN